MELVFSLLVAVGFFYFTVKLLDSFGETENENIADKTFGE